MSEYELLDLLASNYQKIDGLWNFFISIHLAILGALFLMPRRVSTPERLVAFGAYAAFMYVNRSAMLDSYDYHLALSKEAARLAVTPAQTGGLLVQQIAHFDLASKIAFVPYAHFAAGAVVAFAVLFANSLARRPDPGTELD